MDVSNCNLAQRSRPRRDLAEQAVRILIEWAGDVPDREGLIDTPKRVVRAYEEFFSGYRINPEALLETTFEETANYDQMVTRGGITNITLCLFRNVAGKLCMARYGVTSVRFSGSWPRRRSAGSRRGI